jgi:hypothetical protein
MSVALLVIDSLLLLGMVGVSLYGASALPPGARVPVHFGPGAYNNWVPKSVGLLLWPLGGGVVYVMPAVSRPMAGPACRPVLPSRSS